MLSSAKEGPPVDEQTCSQSVSCSSALREERKTLYSQLLKAAVPLVWDNVFLHELLLSTFGITKVGILREVGPPCRTYGVNIFMGVLVGRVLYPIAGKRLKSPLFSRRPGIQFFPTRIYLIKQLIG